MKCVNMLFGMDISFNPSYYKKLCLKGKGFQQPLENTLDHGLHDAETIIKREVPRPGHSRSTTGYKPTGNLQRGISKNKPNPLKGELHSKAPYWVYVQWGTCKMPANPFVTRTANQVAPLFKQYFHEELSKAGLLK